MIIYFQTFIFFVTDLSYSHVGTKHSHKSICGFSPFLDMNINLTFEHVDLRAVTNREPSICLTGGTDRSGTPSGDDSAGLH